MKGAALRSFEIIAEALRVTTERLVREVASPQDRPPSWNEFEWKVARSVCAMHGISSLLATRLRWTGPDDFHEFLDEQRRQTLACQERIDSVLARLHRAMSKTGVTCIALKGAAIRDFHLHHPGERPMGDIDLLVRPGEAERAAEAIVSTGYRKAYAARRHLVFVPEGAIDSHSYGEHYDNPLRIELHQRVSEALPIEAVDITDGLWPRNPSPGLNPYASFVALTRHVMLHASGNMRAHAMRFLQIHEIALLARRMGRSDWTELLGNTPAATAWWMYPALSLAARYVRDSVPAARLEEFAAVCPRRLRARFDRHTVHEVSWSNLRIHALPGVEWSRSWIEALRYFLSRACPSRIALAELAEGVKSKPQLSAGRWYRASHAERIVHWLFSRPPRVQTLYSVQAALSDTIAPLRTNPGNATDPNH